MYQECVGYLGLPPVSVKRVLDNTFIPFDESNVDYQEYLRWAEQGNIPEPSDSEEV
jgi:hypothetical protein